MYYNRRKPLLVAGHRTVVCDLILNLKGATPLHTKEAIQSAMDMSLFVLNSYLADLSDEELMLRPSPECNHLNWQLGHLISSEVHLVNSICPGKGATLPEGFAEQYDKSTTGSDDPAQFRDKGELQALFTEVRAATLAACGKIARPRISMARAPNGSEKNSRKRDNCLSLSGPTR